MKSAKAGSMRSARVSERPNALSSAIVDVKWGFEKMIAKALKTGNPEGACPSSGVVSGLGAAPPALVHLPRAASGVEHS